MLIHQFASKHNEVCVLYSCVCCRWNKQLCRYWKQQDLERLPTPAPTPPPSPAPPPLDFSGLPGEEPSQGQHVKIAAGEFRGMIGVIVKIADDAFCRVRFEATYGLRKREHWVAMAMLPSAAHRTALQIHRRGRQLLALPATRAATKAVSAMMKAREKETELPDGWDGHWSRRFECRYVSKKKSSWCVTTHSL